jgi:hypothetical protein
MFFIGFALFAFIIYLIADGRLNISKMRDKKRQNKNAEIIRKRNEDREKIKLLDKQLKGTGDIEKYILLNKTGLPGDERFQPMLPAMIEELLAIGWTTEMPIYTKYKYGTYRISISNCDSDMSTKSYKIIDKYLERYEQFE